MVHGRLQPLDTDRLDKRRDGPTRTSPGKLLIVDGHLREIREIEIGQLILRYAHTRIERRTERLAASIDRIGQIIPVTVRTEEGSFVLLDGYLRVKALKHLGRDTVMAEIWDVMEEEALGQLLARSKQQAVGHIEEAALLSDSTTDHLSQERIAAMVGRTQGWVSARLTLYRSLSDDLLALIRKGSISTWTATRVIVPIARAIPEHGKVLSESSPTYPSPRGRCPSSSATTKRRTVPSAAHGGRSGTLCEVPPCP